jgi:methylated-DNA-[protein]-cysteine S-methyltransferase
MTLFDALDTPIGTLYLLVAGEALSGLRFKKPHIRAGAAPENIRAELTGYFEGRVREFTLGVELSGGTEFEKQVWLALGEIPYGQTRSYKWLAGRVGRPGGSRAVGQALAKNPVPIVLPCHRVIESHGKIGGYTPGVDFKRRLLALEYYHSMNQR